MFTKKESVKKEANNQDTVSSQSLVKTPNQQLVKTAESRKTTRLIIKYDAGFPNQLFIRGKGGNLSWDKGLPLKNIKSDEWLWETDVNFAQCEFKVLINDRIYENGENHLLKGGSAISYVPKF